MTKRYSDLHDNGGRCEICNSEESIHGGQETHPVEFSDGIGTLWACKRCKPLLVKRDSLIKQIKELQTELEKVKEELYNNKASSHNGSL